MRGPLENDEQAEYVRSAPVLPPQVGTPSLHPRKCKRCNADDVMLFHDPDGTDCRRTVCGVCQGKANRIILDRLNGTKRSDVDEDVLYGRGRR